MSKRQKYLLVLVGIFFFFYISCLVSISNYALLDNKSPSDVILVLGAHAKVGGEINQCLKARVNHAISLYKEKYSNKLLFSGGMDTGTTDNQAEIMKQVAEKMDINSSAIISEPHSRTTYENILNSKKLLNRYGFHSAIIVTDPYHSLRASLVADKMGITYKVSPAQESPCWQDQKYFSPYFLREPFAIVFYKLTGKI